MLRRVLVIIAIALCGVASAQLRALPYRSAQYGTSGRTVLISNVPAPSWCQHLRHPREDACGSRSREQPAPTQSGLAGQKAIAPQGAGPTGRGVPAGMTYGILKVGAGGAVTGIDIQCDQGVGACSPGVGTVTKLSRNNAQGAHWWNASAAGCGNAGGSGCWQEIVSANSLPPDDPSVAPGHYGGVYEAVIAPSNTSHFWMIFNGFVYSSSNRGASWTACSRAQDTTANANGIASGGLGKHIAVDPANENNVIVATPTAGVSYTTTGCTGDWTTISTSSIPASATGVGYLVSYDRSTTSGGSTLGVYVASYGHGVYHTSTGPSGTWTLTSGSPPSFTTMTVDEAGNVWLIDATVHGLTNGDAGGGVGGLNKYQAGSWSNLLNGPGGYFLNDVAIDPNNPSHIFAFVNGSDAIYISTDAGLTWSRTATGGGKNNSTIATDIPWLAYRLNANGNVLYGNPGAVFDPSVSNKLYMAAGLGIFYTNPPTSGTLPSALTWTSQSAAIEEMVINQLVAPGKSGALPVVASWDQCAFQPSMTAYPEVGGVSNSIHYLQSGWAIDWASANPDYVVVICQGILDPVDGATSGISKDGGAHWSKFPTEVSPNAADITASISGTTLTVSGVANGVIDLAHLPETISGVGVSGGTQIIAPLSGTGRAGTYKVSASQTVGSERMAVGPGFIIGGCIAASSSTNILQVQAVGYAASGYPIWYTTDGGSTWHNPDSSLNTIASSWYNNYQATFHSCAADRVDANTFYLYNINVNGGGHDALYISTNGGRSWTQQCSDCAGGRGFGGPFGIVSGLKSAPGLSGYLCFSTGGAPGNNTALHNFWCSKNHGATWTAPSNVENVVTYGFGAAKPGSTGCGGSGCPSIYLAGEADTSGSFVYSFWRSDDWGKTWKDVGSIYPLGIFGIIADIDGDKSAWGTFYIGTYGQGAYYGITNFLLKRDLDPASNDNTPMWAAEAA